MFRDLPAHPAVKSTSLPWAPVIPDHWSVKRAKAIMRAIDVRSATGEEELLTVSSSRGVVPRASANVNMFKAESYIGHKLCWPDDLVINSLWAWGLGLGVAKDHGIVSTAYGVYRQYEEALLPAYLHQLVRSEPFNWELHVRSQGVWKSRLQMTDDRWLDAPLLVPPLEEQAAIVKYLAHANARIDKATAAKRRLIALLEEQMRVETSAVMSQAVSDGSKTLPLKRVIDLRGGMTPSKENLSYWGGDVPWISPKDVKSATLLGSIDRITEAALEQTSISMVSAGSVVIVVRGMILARTVPVAVLGVDATLNQDMKALVPKAGVLEPRYLRDWLKSNEDMLVQLVETAGHGTKKLDTDSLMNVRVAVPSVEVQREVCTRVDQANQAARRTIERIEQEIVLLQEFRIRLVSDAVLGQVDVRAISASLPDAPSGVAMQDIHAAVTDDDFGTDDAGELE